MLLAAGVAAWFAPAIQEARACSVPVFRYALERWPADDYAVFVFHREPLPAKDQAVIDWLGKRLEGDPPPANCRVFLVDLNEDLNPYVKAVWEKQKNAKLPWMVIRYPIRTRIPNDVWAGSPNLQVVKRLLDSPARREIAMRLISGDSVVWAMLQCGDKTKDSEAQKVLHEELTRHEEAMKPHSEEEAQAMAGPGGGALPTMPDEAVKIAFSIVPVDRNDPNEAMFVRVLMQSEPDLWDYEDEPMAFPIFGRGRMLFALVGKGINPETIMEACAFLVGPCFCQAKAANPGTDVLMTADWEAAIESLIVDQVEFEMLTGRREPATTQPNEPNTPAAAAMADSTPERGALQRNVLIALAGIVIVVTTVALLVINRSSHPPA